VFLPSGEGVALSAARRRLEALIVERLKPGVDKSVIDQRIWTLLGQTRAVMFTDLSGFSRHVAKFGIVHFLQTIYESVRIFVPLVEQHDGVLLKAEADSLLVIFSSPRHALSCAIAMQHATVEYNLGVPPEEQILLGVGLGFGEMLQIGEEDVFGAEVNAASKLGEDIAKGGDILVTEHFRHHLDDMDGLESTKLDFIPPGAEGAYAVKYW
jgi:class 3 adenylate cyclase